MAGESAGHSARRMREKAERLNRAADQWERGADGERRTAAVLDELPDDQWTVLHDLPWPGRPRANIDHVVVGPPGVFVIDSKNWTGSIAVVDGVLRQNGRRRETTAAAVEEAAQAVRQLLPALPSVPVQGVLCFVRDEDVTGRAGGALLGSTANVAVLLQTRPAVLDQAAREALVGQLVQSLTRSPASPATGDLALSDRMTVARTDKPRSSRDRRSRGGGRKQRPVAALVGMSLAIGVIGVSVGQPQILDRIGSSLVGFMTDDLGGDQPSDEPTREPREEKRKKPARERRSE